jgi:hypothetical protein
VAKNRKGREGPFFVAKIGTLSKNRNDTATIYYYRGFIKLQREGRVKAMGFS